MLLQILFRSIYRLSLLANAVSCPPYEYPPVFPQPFPFPPKANESFIAGGLFTPMLNRAL